MSPMIQSYPCIIGISLACLSLALPASAKPSVTEQGERLPELSFTDILGAESGTGNYPDHIQIVSFSTKDSSEELMAWMSRMTKQVSAKYPSTALVKFSFADLTEVPGFLRPIARPILKNLIGSKIEPMQDRFTIEPAGDGLTAAKPPEFHLIPDWDGSFLRKFGHTELRDYHLYVAYKGIIFGHFTPDTPNKNEAFLGVFETIQDGIETAKAVASPSPGQLPTDS